MRVDGVLIGTRPIGPGYSERFCPVCNELTGSTREAVSDDRGEVVIYQTHADKAGRPCRMSGKTAAIRAVAFTGPGQ